MAISVIGCGNNEETPMRKPDPIATTKSENNNFTYELSDIDGKNYKIFMYNGDEENIVIPDKSDGYLVIEVGDHVFSNRSIKKVKLGGNVQIIGEHAFSSNSDLKKVVFDDKLKEIKEFAFTLSGLTGNIVIPDSVETIGVSAFELTKIESVELGKGIKYIAGGAFTGNANLKTVTFSNMDVEFENETVFAECPNLTIIAPKGSTAEQYAKINNINFRAKETDDKIYVNNDIEKETTHENDYLVTSSDTNFTFNEDTSKNTCAITEFNGTVGIIEIPDKNYGAPVVEINDKVFTNNSFHKLVLGKNINKIGKYAFANCKNLDTIKFNHKLKIIKEAAFSLSNLKNPLCIPNSVERIENNAFSLTKLETVDIGSGIKSIGSNAFAGNLRLKKITFNNTDVKFEDNTVFENCPNVVIVAPKGSTAEKYAKDNNIKFKEK